MTQTPPQQDYTPSTPFANPTALPPIGRKISVFAGLNKPKPKGLAIPVAEWEPGRHVSYVHTLH